jgi:hypothetical protein
MAELPKVQSAGAQRALLADVPTLRFEDLAVGARGASNIGDALDRMAAMVAKDQELEVRKKAAQFAVDRPVTAAQWDVIRSDSKKLQEYFSGQGRVFKDVFMAAQAANLSSELQVSLENKFDDLKKKLEVGEVTEEAAIADVKNAIDGAAPVVAAMDPEVGLKFKANVAMRGSSVYEKAADVTAKRVKTFDTISNNQYVDNMPSKVGEYVEKSIQAGIPIDFKQIELAVLNPAKMFAAKHGDVDTFYKPAIKAFREAVASRIKDAVNAPASLDNPQIVQQALQSGKFDVEVNVAGKPQKFNFQAEWNYLSEDEKKNVRESFNAAFDSRYNVLTKSSKIAELVGSAATVEFAESLKNKLIGLNVGTVGVDELSISDFISNKLTEAAGTAKATNSPDIYKNARAAISAVGKSFITDFIQSNPTEEQITQIMAGVPVKDAPAINYMLTTADMDLRNELRLHMGKEIQARNELRASEDRRREDIKKDRANDLVQVIFEKPRGSKEVKDALATLKTIDAVRWDQITKGFSASRTQDDPNAVRRLQIARARGELTTDMVLKSAGSLTLNSQEQYFAYALTVSNQENGIALDKARGKLKYTKDIAAAVNKTAADIEAQNSYIAVETEFNNRFLAHRKTIGEKDYKPWNATEEMDKLLAGAVADKQKRVVDGARSRVDSFTRTYLSKDKKYTDADVRKQIQLSIAGQKSDINTKLTPKDLQIYINDLDTLQKGQ